MTTQPVNPLLFAFAAVAVLAFLVLIGVVYGSFQLLKAVYREWRKGGWFIRGRMPK